MANPRGIGRRRARIAHAFAVGAVAAAAAAPGFAPIFPGWNVWQIWQADDPTFSIMTIGESLDRQLQVWVEDQIKDNAPGSAVADPANPLALRGDQIQIIPEVTGLEVAAARGDIPEFAGALQIGTPKSKAVRRWVRFWNRGSATSLPWPHDENYMLEDVYTPSSSSSITNAPQPGSLAGAASSAADAAASGLKVLAVGAGVVLGVVVIAALVNSSRKAAA